MVESKSPDDEIALAIGRLSMRWAHIEHSLHSFCWSAAAWLSEEKGKGRLEAGVFDAIVGDMNFGNLIDVSKRLAHQIEDERFPNLFVDISEIFEHANQKARPERNRWIHDTWFWFDGEFYSYDTKIGFPKVPHQKPSVSYMRKRHFRSSEEMRDVLRWFELIYSDIGLAEFVVNWLASDAREPEETPIPVLAGWDSIKFFNQTIAPRQSRPVAGFWAEKSHDEDS